MTGHRYILKGYIKLIVIALGVLLSSCVKTIHEYPITTSSLVRVQIEVDRTPAPLYKILDNTITGKPTLHTVTEWASMTTKASQDYTVETLNSFVQTKAIDGWTVRLVWELYQADQLVLEGKMVLKELVDNPIFRLELPIPGGEYTLLAWADYVPVGTADDVYFNTENLQYVLTDNIKRLQCTNNEERDSFCAAIPLSVEVPDYSMEIQQFYGVLTRPQGRYVILSDDYADYSKLTNTPVEDNESTISYPSFINTGYNVMKGRPNDSSVKLKYTYTPALYIFENNTCAQVGDDYSFVNGEESVILTNVEITHKKTGYVSNFENTQIPLYANKLTIVIGNYLTGKTSSGGFEISDGFEDEIIIPLK